jgi:DNA-binding NarL/FixJ family response regulator
MPPVIEVTGLTKRYGDRAVVDGISFCVEQGEIFGILGPNGAGKSTTVECLEGLRRRDSGQVRILGLDPQTSGRRLHQRLGVQLQETQLQDKLTVREALLQPDVVLMDLRLPELDGVSAIRLLAQRGVSARVLVLTTFDTDTDVVPAIEAGATGYLLKDSPPAELLRGVRAAARGEAVLSPSVATRLLGQVRAPAREPLSQRELDILGLISRGCSNREAAARLFISEATVKTHVLHIYAKLGVNDRAAAVATGFERGLLPRP